MRTEQNGAGDASPSVIITVLRHVRIRRMVSRVVGIYLHTERSHSRGRIGS